MPTSAAGLDRRSRVGAHTGNQQGDDGGSRPVACARRARLGGIHRRPATVLGARGIWVAGIGAIGEAGEIECERLAVAAATSAYTVRQPALRAPGTVIRPGWLLLIMRWRTAGAWTPARARPGCWRSIRCPRGAPGCGTAVCRARPAWIDPGRTRRLIGSRGNQAAAVMSELDVIVIHIRAGQAAKYERLCVEPELPRWHAAPSSAPGSSVLRPAPASIRMQPRTSSPRGSPVTPGTASTTPIPVQESSHLAGAFQPEDPLVYAGAVRHAI